MDFLFGFQNHQSEKVKKYISKKMQEATLEVQETTTLILVLFCFRPVPFPFQKLNKERNLKMYNLIFMFDVDYVFFP